MVSTRSGEQATTKTGLSSRMIWKGDRKARTGGHPRDPFGSAMNLLGSRGKPGLPPKPRLLPMESGGGVGRRRQGVSRFRTGKDSLAGFVSHLCPTFFGIRAFVNPPPPWPLAPTLRAVNQKHQDFESQDPLSCISQKRGGKRKLELMAKASVLKGL